MERSDVARKHMRNASSAAHSPAKHIRNKSSALASQSMTPPTTSSSSTRTLQDPGDLSTSQLARKRLEDDKRHFIGNVGTGGTLYFAPSRLPHQVNVLPATPPDTAQGHQDRPTRLVTASGTWSSRLRGASDHASLPGPPLSLANAGRRRLHRPRSRSVSTLEETIQDPTQEMQRSKSSLDAADGLLDLQIPHYRLGTPRFSDKGTAYLRSSVYTDSTIDRSSLLSQSAFDCLFPLPPGKTDNNFVADDAFFSRASVHHLHPSTARNARLSLRPSPNTTVQNPMSVFDRLESNPNDPSIVRFSPQGHILAATIPRLVLQITSPRFLDYELLSDFFLTYRGFLKSHDLLNWLMMRMSWAISNNSDDGRIVRVRTFVAIRHWILNYFADDFVPSLSLRQQCCEQINHLTAEMRGRQDSGAAGDLNIVGELKKCWRRTSALFYPTADAADSSITDDITPGAMSSSTVNTPDGNLLKSIREATLGASNQALLNQFVAIDQRTNQKARVVSFDSAGFDQGNFPASPMSEDSLQVLSCSVPFLQNIRPGSHAEKRAQQSAPRPAAPKRQNSLTKQRDAQAIQHRRTESDTVSASRRISNDRAYSIDVESLPSITLTGGLVRGILLQPTPAICRGHAPPSPPPEESHYLSAEDDQFDDTDSHHLAVKRLVGEMRRALSVKKGNSESSGRSNHSASSGSRGSNPLRHENFVRSVPSGVNSSTSLKARKDVLAARLQSSYRKHFVQPYAQAPQGDYLNRLPTQQGHDRALSVGDFGARFDSQITTGSRSIMIVDATSVSPLSARNGPSTESNTLMPLFPGLMDAQRFSETATTSDSALSKQQDNEVPGDPKQQSQSIDGRLHGSFVFPSPPNFDKDAGGRYDQLDKSCDTHKVPSHEMRPIPHQLRRRPGGDLKAADHVHELKPQETLHAPADSRPISRSRSKGTVESLSGQPSHVRSSFRSTAQRLAKVRARSQGSGGVEDALARLEGKTHRRKSTMSWLELPKNDELDEQVDRGMDFEIMNPRTTSSSQFPQIYRMSRADYSGDSSPIGLPRIGSKLLSRVNERQEGAFEPASSLSGDLDNNAVHLALKSDKEQNRKTDTGMDGVAIQRSFLLDDNESLSDISTDIAEGFDDDSTGVRSFFFEEPTDDEVSDQMPRLYMSNSNSAIPGEQTGKRAPSLKVASPAAKILGVPPGNLLADAAQTRPKRKRPDLAGHFPFVLAFESKVIAEQLCIIEKDALDEVDWKDLVALNWQHTPSQIRNWADYLKLEESNGIDLIVARFNLMVKWVVSECVLTEPIVDRARCITKYIHIATHCLRLHNYASMAQITLALLSSDLTRLRKTWAFVLPADKRVLEHLESLCKPLHNFHNLRAEMEGVSLVDGCIPFIGLYTHDLMYNAQKPAWLRPIPPADDNATLLLNFERYQTAATITKNLLRLLDASARYVFRPHPEALSRCLWLAALEDPEIAEVSMDLE